MKDYGKLQRRFFENKPAETYDIEKSVVYIDFEKGTQTGTDGTEVNGYYGYQIEIDRLTSDYGHVKSQLIEAAYPQKDEFGLVMNFCGMMYNRIAGTMTDEEIKASDDFTSFAEFQEWRSLASEAAKKVIKGE